MPRRKIITFLIAGACRANIRADEFRHGLLSGGGPVRWQRRHGPLGVHHINVEVGVELARGLVDQRPKKLFLMFLPE